MESNVDHIAAANAVKKESSNEAQPSNNGGLKGYGQKLANNIDPLNLYARLKDYYKGIEIAAPWMADILTRGAITSEKSKKFQENKSNMQNAAQKFSQLDQDPSKWSKKDANKSKGWARDFVVGFWKNKNLRDEESNADRVSKLQTGVAGDTAFFGIQALLSWFSGWAEKEQVKRTFGDIASVEFKKPKAELNLKDLRKSKNPLLREAASYYGKKAFLRSITDFAGLLRWVPFLIYKVQDKGVLGTKFLKATEENKLINHSSGEKSTRLGRNLNRVEKFGDGIKALMFAKTFFFQWYFSSRQTGSFYEAKNIWNITEGIATAPNRALNENTDTGEFVTRQHITKLYQRFQEENPEMGLAEFTRDDPLSSRVFEQTARYLNHTYMPKLFAISEPGKQQDLPSKNITHAMLVEFVGTGGLRVEDALGSSLRLEVMAYHGSKGVRNGIEKYHEVSAVLENLPRPERGHNLSQEETVEQVREYLSQIDAIGREYLGSHWPPKYMNEELKRGFIKAVFEGKQISQERIDYMASAIFMRDNEQSKSYAPKESDPASELLDTSKENARELNREDDQRERLEQQEEVLSKKDLITASHTKKESFAKDITRKRPTDVMEKAQNEEAPSQTHHLGS